MSKKLDFNFLAINNDFFKLGLNPTQLLLLAKIDELVRNCGDCYMSDKAFADTVGVSESTIKREMKKLDEEFSYITRETKNIKGGKERHIKINYNQIKQKLTSINLTLVNEDNEVLQGSNCPLTSINLTLDKGQNDTIKENLKEKEKEKGGIDNSSSLRSDELSIPKMSPEEEGMGNEENPGVEEVKVNEISMDQVKMFYSEDEYTIAADGILTFNKSSLNYGKILKVV